MSVSLEDVFVQCGEQYKLKLVAGKDGCNTAIGWVHLIEEPSIIQFLWSNDLVVTLGVSFQEEDALFDCIKRLVKRNTAGFVINTGKYVNEIPQYIIDYCNENSFPLITIPWEINIMAFIKDVTTRCLNAQRADQVLATHFIDAFKDPGIINQYRNDLMARFDVEGEFEVILLEVDNAVNYSDIQLQRVSARIRYYFENIDCKYLLFWYDSYLVLIVNNIDEEKILELTRRMYNRAKRKMPEYPLHIGVGSKLNDLENVPRSFYRARAALKAALTFEKSILEYKNLGIYQVLFSIEDTSILKEFYEEKLRPILEYDKKHHTELEKTLECYVRNKGSIQMISEMMFTHRNTINYRLTKIKELLDTDFEDSNDFFEYQFAFYVKEIEDKSHKL